MGRGRQKAKQAKVARALKYDSGSTDLAALQAELAGSRPEHTDASDLEGDYSEWIDAEDDDEEDEEEEDEER